MKAHNKLSLGEVERLALLSEECAEVIQIIGKILRHGFDNHHPNDSPCNTNRKALERELGDVRFAYRLMCDSGDISLEEIKQAMLLKNLKVSKYLFHQGRGGTDGR